MYVFEPTAVKENAIGALAEALRKHPEARDEVILRVDNGPQYASNTFRRSAKALGGKAGVHSLQDARTERQHRIVPRQVQGGIRMAPGPQHVSGSEQGDSRCVHGLQREEATLRPWIHPPLRIHDEVD